MSAKIKAYSKFFALLGIFVLIVNLVVYLGFLENAPTFLKLVFVALIIYFFIFFAEKLQINPKRSATKSEDKS